MMTFRGLLLLLPCMALDLACAGPSGIWTTGSDTEPNGSVTIGSGSNRALVCWIVYEQDTIRIVTAFTVGGVAPSNSGSGLRYDEAATSSDSHIYAYIWNDAAIASMSGSTVSFTDNSVATNIGWGCRTYQDVDQTALAALTAFSGTATGAGTTTIDVTTTSTANDYIVVTAWGATTATTFSAWDTLSEGAELNAAASTRAFADGAGGDATTTITGATQAKTAAGLVLPGISTSTTHYICPSASGANSGTSPTDAWQSVAGYNAATFVAGSDVYTCAGEEQVISAVPRNTTFTGASGNPAVFGAYHLESGSPVTDLARTAVSSLTCSAGTVTVDTATDHYLTTGKYAQVWDVDQDEYIGRHQVTVTDNDTFTYTIAGCAAETTGSGPIVAQHDWPRFLGRATWSDHDWNGAWSSELTDAELIAAVPPCTNNGTTCSNVANGTVGILNFDYPERQYITVENVAVGHSAGWGIDLVAGDNVPEPGITLDNVYVFDTLAQPIHLSNAQGYSIINSWITGGCQTHKYIGGGSTRAAIAMIGDDGNDDINGLVRGNHVWDNLCGEGINTNRIQRGVSIVDNVIIDPNLSAIYLEAAPKQLVAYNVGIRTDRTAYTANLGTHTGLLLNNESTEPPDWGNGAGACTTANLEDARTQEVLAISNVFAGFDYSFHPASQATNQGGADCVGHPSHDHVYLYLNTFLDPNLQHVRMLNAGHVDLLPAGTEPRIWGSAFIDTVTPRNMASQAQADWTGFIDRNYFEGSLASFPEWNPNVISSGCSMPLTAYGDLDRFMDTDAAGHMSVAQLRNFERNTLGLDPDDLTDRNISSLAIFSLTGANCGQAGPLLSSLTFPPELVASFPGGVSQTLVDARHQPLPSSPDIGALLQNPVCSPCFTDNFNRADEILDVSADWTAVTGGRNRLQVDNNRVESNGTASASPELYLAPDQGSADHYVEADWLGSNDGLDYLVARPQGINDFAAGITGGTASLLRFRKMISGTFTTFATASSVGVTRVRIEVEGTDIRFYTDTGSGMALRHTQSSVTDFQTETSAGFRSQAANNVDGVALWDNFEHGAL